MEYRESMLLIFAGMLITMINMMFSIHFIIYIVATGLLIFAAGLILTDKKKRKGYKSVWELFKGEYDVFILMGGVILFGVKFLVPEPLQSSLHLLSLSTIFLVLALGRYRKSNREIK